jgi:sulfite exporter TauE/SafE
MVLQPAAALLEPAAVLPEGIGPYIALMAVGFLVGAYGHLMRSRWVVAIGVIMIFLATLLFPLAIHVFEDRPEPPPGPQINP